MLQNQAARAWTHRHLNSIPALLSISGLDWQMTTGGGPEGVGLSVDSTTFFLSVYNLQQKFEQNLHLQINPKIYNLRFQQNALKYLKNRI